MEANSESRSDRKRKALLLAAAGVSLNQGYDGTSMTMLRPKPLFPSQPYTSTSPTRSRSSPRSSAPQQPRLTISCVWLSKLWLIKQWWRQASLCSRAASSPHSCGLRYYDYAARSSLTPTVSLTWVAVGTSKASSASSLSWQPVSSALPTARF